MAQLTIRNLQKSFANTKAVENADLEVGDGELICLLGPSGSGKSTILRMIGGFEQPTAGSILIDGQDVTRLPPERRPTGMMFQSHALWSHMSVFGNIAFGLKLRRLPRATIEEKVKNALNLVGLKGYGERMTHQLSGGQQQRVALARSLVLEPKILLLDEPFASLDQHLREHLREEVRDIQQRLGITTLFVTHGQDEALAMADRIAVLKDGRIEQIAPADVIYRQPQTEFVSGFIGTMNFIKSMVRNGRFEHPDLGLPMPIADGEATLAIRPEQLVLTATRDEASPVVTRFVDFGSYHVVDVQLSDGNRLKVMTDAASRWRKGDRVAVLVNSYTAFRDQQLAYTSTDTHELEPQIIHA